MAMQSSETQVFMSQRMIVQDQENTILISNDLKRVIHSSEVQGLKVV